MRWLRERADLREQITSTLTGLPPTAARKKTPEFQGGLLDSFLEDGDITVRQFDEAFDPCDLVVYGPASTFFRRFRERMPWDDESPANQELVGFLLVEDFDHVDGVADVFRTGESDRLDEAFVLDEQAGDDAGAQHDHNSAKFFNSRTP